MSGVPISAAHVVVLWSDRGVLREHPNATPGLRNPVPPELGSARPGQMRHTYHSQLMSIHPSLVPLPSAWLPVEFRTVTEGDRTEGSLCSVCLGGSSATPVYRSPCSSSFECQGVGNFAELHLESCVSRAKCAHASDFICVAEYIDLTMCKYGCYTSMASTHWLWCVCEFECVRVCV